MSKTLRSPVSVDFSCNKIKSPINIKIDYGFLNIWYLGYHIWAEKLEGASANFGLESVDHIAKIILLIDSGDDEKWRSLVYKEK